MTRAITVTTEKIQSFDNRTTHKLTVSVLDIEDGRYRNPRAPTWTERNDEIFADLSLAVYVDDPNRSDSMLNRAWDVRYRNVFELDVRGLEARLHTLKRIDKRLDKMRDTEGYAQDFGQMVNRFARAVGADHLVVFSGQGWSYDKHENRKVNLGDIADQVRSINAALYPKPQAEQDIA